MRSFHGDITVGLVQEHELPEPMRGKQLGFNVNTPVELAEEKARLEGKSNGANGGVRSARRVSKQTPGSDSETNEEVA